jgi:hypothetical protein
VRLVFLFVGVDFGLTDVETESIFSSFSESKNKCCIIDNDFICRHYGTTDTDVLPCVFDSEVIILFLLKPQPQQQQQ